MTIDDLPRLFKDVRFMRDESIRATAETTGLSASFISRLDNGTSKLDLDSAKIVARYLSLDIVLRPRPITVTVPEDVYRTAVGMGMEPELERAD